MRVTCVCHTTSGRPLGRGSWFQDVLRFRSELRTLSSAGDGGDGDGSRSAASPAAKQVGGKAAVKLKPKSGRFAQATKERRPLFFTSIGTVLVTVYRKEWGVILKVVNKRKI